MALAFRNPLHMGRERPALRQQGASVGYDSKANVPRRITAPVPAEPTMLPAEKTQEPGSAPAGSPSKSSRKRAMHDLQELGEALIVLDPARLAALALPERLTDAIVLARTITQHEGRRRQLQYIGRLMRDIDPAPLRAALAEWERGPGIDRARFAAAERWRDRVMLEPEGVAAFAAAHPDTDQAALATLVADARAERTRGSPPHKYRALFRLLKKRIDATPVQ